MHACSTDNGKRSQQTAKVIVKRGQSTIMMKHGADHYCATFWKRKTWKNSLVSTRRLSKHSSSWRESWKSNTTLNNRANTLLPIASTTKRTKTQNDWHKKTTNDSRKYSILSAFEWTAKNGSYGIHSQVRNEKRELLQHGKSYSRILCCQDIQQIYSYVQRIYYLWDYSIQPWFCLSAKKRKRSISSAISTLCESLGMQTQMTVEPLQSITPEFSAIKSINSWLKKGYVFFGCFACASLPECRFPIEIDSWWKRRNGFKLTWENANDKRKGRK